MTKYFNLSETENCMSILSILVKSSYNNPSNWFQILNQSIASGGNGGALFTPGVSHCALCPRLLNNEPKNKEWRISKLSTSPFTQQGKPSTINNHLFCNRKSDGLTISGRGSGGLRCFSRQVAVEVSPRYGSNLFKRDPTAPDPGILTIPFVYIRCLFKFPASGGRIWFASNPGLHRFTGLPGAIHVQHLPGLRSRPAAGQVKMIEGFDYSSLCSFLRSTWRR